MRNLAQARTWGESSMNQYMPLIETSSLYYNDGFFASCVYVKQIFKIDDELIHINLIFRQSFSRGIESHDAWFTSNGIYSVEIKLLVRTLVSHGKILDDSLLIDESLSMSHEALSFME